MAKTVILIDGTNMFMTALTLNLRIDYIKLRKVLEQEFGLSNAYYYTAIHEDEKGYQRIRTLTDALEFAGFRLVTKEAKEYEDDKIKGNMDVEIAVDALNATKYAERIILVTGDGDFTYLVKEIQRRGLETVCVSTKDKASYGLRRTVDRFIDLLTIKEKITHGVPKPTLDPSVLKFHSLE